MKTYRCYDILNELNERLNDCTVSLSVCDMNDAVERQYHRDSLCDALENIVGPVESFSYYEENVV